MQRKVPSAIANITLNRATFTDVLIDGLTFVNFFYGNNGAGKSSIAHAISAAGMYAPRNGCTPSLTMTFFRCSANTGSTTPINSSVGRTFCKVCFND